MKPFYLFSLCMLLALLTGCVVPKSLKEHQEFTYNNILNNPNLIPQYIEQDSTRLRYVEAGKAKQAVAVWIHGTPGGWSDIGKLLVDEQFLSEIKLVSIDRPGWGGSVGSGDIAELSQFDQQNKYISPLLVKLKQDHPDVPLIVAGHSWGGSLAPYIAAENSEIVDGLMVFAGGLSGKLVKPRWYNKLAKTRAVKSFLGPGMQAANIEVYALQPQLNAFFERWSELTMPVLVVQGEKDELVSPKNADFAETVLDPQNSKVVRLKKQGHLLQIERTGVIADCMIAMASNSLDLCQDNR